MNHPELIAVPILMLADYALTILGVKNSAAVYRNHFTIPSHELNPLWRKSVDQIRWLNPRHIAIVALITILLILIDQATALPYDTFEVVLGALFGVFGSVCGRHFTNLMFYRYLNRHPNEISGQVHLSMKLMLKLSQYTYIGLIPLFALVVILAPSPYTVGVLFGLLSVVGIHFAWARKIKPAAPQSEHAVEAELIDAEP
jgi:hypothetical protein